MKVIETMIHTALRDDSATTIGLRTLLGHSATPWGVYHANLPENPDFTSAKKYVTHFMLTGLFDTTYPRNNYNTITKQETYQITVYGGDSTNDNDDILERVKYVLEGKHKTTNPTSDAQVFSVKCEWEGPETWDNDYKIFYKQSRYRVWLQDLTITG